MNLDKMTVNIKPLPVYQAMDLGLSIARAWYGDLWRLWWQSPALWLGLVASVMLAMFPMYGQAEFAVYFWLIFGLWWLKPLHERRLVIFLSQKLFNNEYQIEDVPQLAKTMPKVRFMLFKRLGSRRMMVMPVHLLEGQTGKNAKTRLKALTRRQDGQISSHGAGFFILEMAIWLVGYETLLSLCQLGSNLGSEVELEIPQWLDAMLFVLSYFATISLLTPFFVASGFAMYLCKRSQLEGWDIELTFRKLLRRYQDGQKHLMADDNKGANA